MTTTTRYYAGIGSRQTPAEILTLMSTIASRHAQLGWCLRSGAAEGADAAFEKGATATEIWLPWPHFNDHQSLRFPTQDALSMAARLHPAWHHCSRGARLLHARNCHQVLGEDLQTPVTHVVCWTRGGRGDGGTGQALRIAAEHGVPVFDLGKGVDETVAQLARYVRDMLAIAGGALPHASARTEPSPDLAVA